MVHTSLTNPENNKPLKFDENNRALKSEIIMSIQHRIKAHDKYIERHREILHDNLGFSDIVEEMHTAIKAREAKIEELKELIEYTFLIS